jgi:hypothetical protein
VLSELTAAVELFSDALSRMAPGLQVGRESVRSGRGGHIESDVIARPLGPGQSESNSRLTLITSTPSWAARASAAPTDVLERGSTSSNTSSASGATSPPGQPSPRCEVQVTDGVVAREGGIGHQTSGTTVDDDLGMDHGKALTTEELRVAQVHTPGRQLDRVDARQDLGAGSGSGVGIEDVGSVKLNRPNRSARRAVPVLMPELREAVKDRDGFAPDGPRPGCRQGGYPQSGGPMLVTDRQWTTSPRRTTAWHSGVPSQ